MNKRLQIIVRGAVQGVGFRPFIFRLAKQLLLTGYVQNNSSGILIEAEGENDSLVAFLSRIRNEKPPNALISSFEFSFHDPAGFSGFEIRESTTGGVNAITLLLPDISLCDDCKKEMLDKANRRYLYPFINCTNCGPRYSIIENLPYDRKNTSMKIFDMCEDCRREYEDPKDRRFHAQPIACPKCGPHIELWDPEGKIIAMHSEALTLTSSLLRKGKIIALKGLGGFQLIADASKDCVVACLRKRKRRDEKPFALMFPDIESVRKVCCVSGTEENLLKSAESPILLLKKRKPGDSNGNIHISDCVAPANPGLGIMLPYTPLHYLIMEKTGIPLIATSGNLSEEPMCIDEYEALVRLKGIADYFLVHNRPIVRYIDDSVVRVLNDRIMILRRSRGYAPLPVTFNCQHEENPVILALGGQLKNSVALNINANEFVVSQHIGDLTNIEAMEAFDNVIKDFERIYSLKPDFTVCDLHPEYLSAKYAEANSSNIIYVQHHIAHIASCRMENQVQGTALGVAWDGTGYGLDGTIWGGEFFLINGDDYRHFAQLKQFQLPGGEKAIYDIKRSALGVLYEMYGSELWEKDFLLLKSFSSEEKEILRKQLECKINCVTTSSMGRLFDAASALTGVILKSSFEAQAAMMLEFIAEEGEPNSYHFNIEKKEKYIIDWRPVFNSIIEDISLGSSAKVISAKFHNALAEMICLLAGLSCQKKVILSGGCFQNALLLEKTINILQVNGFIPYWHQRIPANDGGISLGQLSYALNKIRDEVIQKSNQ